MRQLIAKYGDQAGAKIECKESFTWQEFTGVTKMLQGKSSDPVAANNELIKIGVTKFIDVGGAEITEKLPILKKIETLDARDAMRVVKYLTSLIQDDDDPKET